MSSKCTCICDIHKKRKIYYNHKMLKIFLNEKSGEMTKRHHAGPTKKTNKHKGIY